MDGRQLLQRNETPCNLGLSFFAISAYLMAVKSARNITAFFCASIFCASSAIGQGLKAVRTADGIQITEGKSSVFFYQARPKSLNGKYERADYIHPLFSLAGNVITEDFPADHLHQRGIYWAWHQIISGNKRIADGWSCENISWEVVNTAIDKVKGAVVLNNDVLWKSVLEDKLVPVIREKSTIAVYPAHGAYRVIDFGIQLFPVLDSMKLGGSLDEKGYSGFSLRLKLPDDIRFLTKAGEVQAQNLAVDGGPWMDFRGSFDGKSAAQSGVAVFCHPSNPGYPQPWIIRSEKSMQNPAFPGREPVTLPKEGLKLQYRVVIHDGSVDGARIATLFEDYVKASR
jgi:hypothetical protein